MSVRTGSRGRGAGAGVCCQPRFEVSVLTGGAARARLESTEWHFSTELCDLAACLCVLMNILYLYGIYEYMTL